MELKPVHAKKSILAIGIVIFFVISIFGLPLSGMSMNMEGEMIGCPYMDMGEASICHMSLFEHISMWQTAFASVIAEHGSLSLLVLLAIALALTLTHLLRSQRQIAVLPVDHRLRRREVKRSVFFQEAFSNGILNPKLF